MKYYLVNGVTKQQVGPVDESEIVMHCMNLGWGEFQSVYVWTEGMGSWEALAKIPHLLKATESKVQAQDTHEPYPQIERRQHERVVLRLKAILSNQEQTFMAYTKDISESGLSLEVQAPAHFFSDSLEILLIDESTQKRIKFQAAAVLDKANPKRFYFLAMSQARKNELLGWIHSFQEKVA